MTEFNCEKCDIKIAESKSGEMVIFCHSEKPTTDVFRISLEKILAAAAREQKGREILMEFYLTNQDIKFI